nr:hypothetical protein [Tanacetum cinerariifolium]
KRRRNFRPKQQKHHRVTFVCPQLLKEPSNHDLIKPIILDFNNDSQDTDEEVEEIKKEKTKERRPEGPHQSFYRNEESGRVAYACVVLDVSADVRWEGESVTAYLRLSMRCLKGYMIMSDQKRPFGTLSYQGESSSGRKRMCNRYQEMIDLSEIHTGMPAAGQDIDLLSALRNIMHHT